MGAVLDDFGDFKPSGPGRDHIHILAPNRRRWVVPIKGRTLTIGRGPESDLTLEDDRVSRNHLRVEFDGSAYRLIDQNSRNGTFLGDARLLAGVAEPWPNNQVLRVGDHSLRLISTETARKLGLSAANPPPERSANVSKPTKRPSASLVQVHVEPTELAVDPGEQTQLEVSVSNFSEQVVHYKVGLTGVPDNWMTITPSDFIQLMPSGEGHATILIRPPHSTKTRAGRFRLEVTAANREDRNQIFTTKATLIIGELGDYKIELPQNKAKVGQPLRITIRNQSNKPHKFAFSCWDEANELTFAVAKKVVEISAGESLALEFTARAKKWRWIGGPKEHRFQAKVKSDVGEGREQSVQGLFISRGLIPPWVPPVALAVAVAVAGFGLFAYRTYQNARATETAVAVAVTQTAIEHETEVTATTIANETAVAATATAQAVATASAHNAATQTETAKQEANATKAAEIALTQTAEAKNEAKTAANAATATQDARNATATAEAKEATQTAEALNAAQITQTAVERATATEAAIMTQSAADQQVRDAHATEAQAARDAASTSEAKTNAANAAATEEAKNARATEEQRARDAQATEAARVATEQARPVPTATPQLRSMNIGDYCQLLGWQGSTRDGSGAYSWRCKGPNGARSDFLSDTDYNALCAQQYGFGSFAVLSDPSRADAWACAIP